MSECCQTPAVLRLALLCWLAATAPAGAQSVGLGVDLPLGGYYRAGSWIPVNCALTNQGPPADVTLAARMQEYGPNAASRRYELSVSLPSPAYRRYSLYLQPADFYGTRPLVLQLLQDQRVVARQEPALSALNEGDRLVAVITAQEGGFGGLAGLRLPPAPRPTMGYPGMNRAQGQVQVAYVKPELAPDRAIGYDVADLVILDRLPSGALTPAQELALTRWVEAGGTLVVTGGAETGALQSPAMRALLPARITGTVTLDWGSVLRGLASIANASAPSPAAGQLVASACQPKPGSLSVEARPGVPILCAGPVGSGQVVFLAADPTRPPLRGWDGVTELLRHYLLPSRAATPYLSAIAAASAVSAGPGGYNTYYGRPASLADACEQVSQMDVPGVAFIGVFLLAYIVALVPANYYFLKRRDRRELAWFTTPAIIVAFSGIAYGVGYGTKGGQAVLAQAGVVEAWAGRGAAPALAYLGLFSPRKTRYDLGSEDGSVPLMPVGSEREPATRDARVVEGDAFGLKDVPVDMWDMALFRGDTVVDLGDGFQSDLRGKNGEITGHVTNGTPFDLEDTMLVDGSAGPVFWGTFRRGETRAINGPWNPSAGGSLLPPAVLQTVRGTLAPARMRRALLESLTTWMPSSFGGSWAPPDHPVLLGWVDRPLVPTRVDGHPVQNQAAYLFLVHLSVK